MKNNKSVIYWLLTGCILIFIMVLVGGITRLTHSGLSISNYKLISGTLPPLNAKEWQEAFDLYKQYPEYQKLNSHFTIEDFKSIFFWEWLHRVIGRFIGLVFIIPFIYFLIKKKLNKSTLKKCFILLGLGAFQGFLGWYMVKSGLINRPDVSHFRLAAHLTTAFITCAYSFWVALDLIFPEKKPAVPELKKVLQISLFLLITQIIWGAFVAGLDAGFIHNHWPLMSEGKLIHETVYIEQTPFTKNFIEGKSGVQFIHRYLAYIVVAIIIYIGYKSRKIKTSALQKKGVQILVSFVILQFGLGVLTLVLAVPLWLGIAHQIVAFLLLGAMTFTLHRFSK
ncbi:cytochrome c oxidase assembly protein subunit 15 [Maribacter vaceletii]|uniref:Heme A synthase n=1 Tax=Maribacter vaceletii TaxID=1206816 RepID=A0A495E5T0_9FLAO|nr:COX15/CtaA family protein [Maribacter vaceletii]RKR12288.1 cytochrome c oxidase assembly protein subunit 15 [Maribacter vaceletii]